MPVPTPIELLAFLQEHEFLTPSQAQQFAGGCLTKFADGRMLARELVDRNWLTAYQANQILQDRGTDLVLGPYRILDRLGEGGMGHVFKARHLNMDRTVALKIIPRDLVSHPQAVARFYQEVRAVAKLFHPNIVTAFDANQVGQTHYLAMELVDGIDLARLIQQSGPLPIANACEYIRQAAVGLQHAHEKGLVHRDIKPGNLMVARLHPDEPPIVKILDFGLARFESESGNSGRLTQLGKFLGTVDYMAPEQAQNPRTAEIRADIYSLGCSLFYLLTGEPPFSGKDAAEQISARILGDAPSVRQRRPEISPALERVLAKLMARYPHDRYQTPSEVAKALKPHTREERRARNSTRSSSNSASDPSRRYLDSAKAPVQVLAPTVKEFDFLQPHSDFKPRRGVIAPLSIALAVVVVLLGIFAGVIVMVAGKCADDSTKRPALIGEDTSVAKTTLPAKKPKGGQRRQGGSDKASVRPARDEGTKPVSEPRPIARWMSERDATDSIGTLHGTLKGGAVVANGRLQLKSEKCYMETGPLPHDIREKTLEVWVRLADLAQRGRMLIFIKRYNPHCWDGILFAEGVPGKWYPGSSYNHRSRNLNGSVEDSKPDQMIHLAIVYASDFSITLYRNGQVYGVPFFPQSDAPTLQTYPKESSGILLGSELPKSLVCEIEEASLYDRALTGKEVADLFRNGPVKEKSDKPPGIAKDPISKKAMQDHKSFSVEELSMKTAALELAAKATRMPDRLKSIINEALALLDEAEAADYYEPALPLANLALESARKANLALQLAKKSPNLSLGIRCEQRWKRLNRLKTEYAKIKNEVATLASKPRDAKASRIVGAFHCFEKGDWTPGLPLLAQGDDAALAKLAREDLAGPKDVAEQAKLGHAWRKFADEQEKEHAAMVRRRARHWLYLAFPSLKGQEWIRAIKGLERDIGGQLYRPGLVVELFSDEALNRKLKARIDYTIQANWGFAAPDAGVPADHFSIRWRGYLLPPRAGKYKLAVWHDDGIRLSVDGIKRIDSWGKVGNDSAEIMLSAQPHTLVLEYHEYVGPAAIHLKWSQAGVFTEQTVPIEVLFHSPNQERLLGR